MLKSRCTPHACVWPMKCSEIIRCCVAILEEKIFCRFCRVVIFFLLKTVHSLSYNYTMIALVNVRTTWCQKVLVLYFATILFVPLSSARMMPSLHCHRSQPISVLTKNSCKIHTLDILVTLTVCQRLLEHACHKVPNQPGSRGNVIPVRIMAV